MPKTRAFREYEIVCPVYKFGGAKVPELFDNNVTRRTVEGLRMGSHDGNIAGDSAWVKDHIESRIERGKLWRGKIEQHKRLAQASKYVRILGRGFRPVSISDVNPRGHLRTIDDQEILSCESLEDTIKKADPATERTPHANRAEHRV